MSRLRTFAGFLSFIAAAAAAGAASAQDAEFYKGKRINLVVGFNPGGGYDTYARAVARHWTNHIPGQPSFVIQNMPGAGSLIAANHLFNVAAGDGTVLGAVNPNIASTSLLKPGRAKFDLRQFHWIGSPERLTMVGAVSGTAPVQTLEALKTREMIVAGAGSATVLLPTVGQKILGLKFRVISGYPGTKGSMLAIERGEVHGAAISYTSFKSGYGAQAKEGKLKLFTQFGLRRHPELPDVPMMVDLATDKDQRTALRFVLAYQEMGRPTIAPPGVPAARVTALRRSFDAVMKDPAFLAYAKKHRLDIDADYPKGEELQETVAEIYATPASVIEQLRKLELQ